MALSFVFWPFYYVSSKFKTIYFTIILELFNKLSQYLNQFLEDMRLDIVQCAYCVVLSDISLKAQEAVALHMDVLILLSLRFQAQR